MRSRSIAAAAMALPLVVLAAPSVGGAGDPARPHAIERVDFRDGTVSAGGTLYRLRAGRLAAPDPEDSALTVSIDAPAFGRIAGLAGEVAAIVVRSHDRDASGFFSELNLFAMRGGKPVLVADLPGGDRAEGGIHVVRFAGGRLIIESYAPSASGGACCPAFVDTVRYRFVAGKLQREGKPTRRTAIQDKDY